MLSENIHFAARKFPICVIFLFTLIFTNVTFAVDWPCYRGPNHDGTTSESIGRWPPVEIWETQLGYGFSGVSVSQGRVYVTGWNNNAARDYLWCFDENSTTGMNPVAIWSNSCPDSSGVRWQGTRATPTVDGNQVYTFSSEGRLDCWDTATGSNLWEEMVSGPPGEYGFASSPYIEGSMVIVNAHGHGVAIDKTLGSSHDFLWGMDDPGNAGFASAYGITIGTQRTIVTYGPSYAYGIDPVSGMILWQDPVPRAPQGGYCDPVICGNKIWITAAQGCGSTVVNLGSGILTNVVWANNNVVDQYSVGLVYNGYIYGMQDAQDGGGGGLRCVDFNTGNLMWVSYGISKAFEEHAQSPLILASNELVVLDDTGFVVVVPATSTGYSEHYPAQTLFPGDFTMTSPTLSNGRLYIRSYAGRMACYDVSPIFQDKPPVVTDASGATAVGVSTATLNGQLVSTGTAATVVSVYWGATDGGTNAASWNHVVNFGARTPGPVSTNITGLNAGATYYYRYYVSNAIGVAWAPASSPFTTISAPIVDNGNGATGIMPDGATLTGDLSAGGYADVSVCWGATDGGTTLSNWQHVNDLGILSQGSFSLMVGGLTPTNTCYYRCYGTNAAGSAWAGSTVTFQTPSSRLAAWPYHMQIAFSGYNKPETLTNFPILVVLNTNLSGFSYSQFASTNGYDLRFTTDATGSTNLNYEFDEWAINGNSFVWVQVPQLTAGSCIWAFWGNSSAPQQQACTLNGTTWDSAFACVWHLKEATGVTAEDSTVFGNNCTPFNSPIQTTGVIGEGLSFNGSSSYLRMNQSAMTNRDNWTLEGWMNPGTLYQHGFVVYNGNDTGGYGFSQSNGSSDPGGKLGGLYGSAAWLDSGFTFPSSNTWYHVVLVRSSGTASFYVNGAKTPGTSTATPNNPQPYCAVGCQDGGRLFNGKIDEARISNIARSSNWIWACYMTMASNTTFGTYGAVQGSSSSNAPRGTPISWLQSHGFSGDWAAAEDSDPDNDGLKTWQEYIAGTDPTNPASVLKIVVATPVTGGAGGFTIDWQGVSGKTYTVQRSTNLLLGAWSVLTSGISGVQPMNVYTAAPDTEPRRFYRIKVGP